MLNCRFFIVSVTIVAFSMFSKAEAQIVIDSKFKAMSLDELVAPVRMATEAFEKAEKEFEATFVKAFKEDKKGNYQLALFYLDRCSRINKRFDYNIYNQQQLMSYIQSVNKKIKGSNNKTTTSTMQTITLNNSSVIPLRQLNNINSAVVTELPPYATITILEKNDDEVLMKVRFGESVGYISKAWLKLKKSETTNNISRTVNNNTEQIITLKNSSSIPMRKFMDVNSDIVTEIPPYATITLLGKYEDKVFMKIKYKDFVGYIAKGWLKVK